MTEPTSFTTVSPAPSIQSCGDEPCDRLRVFLSHIRGAFRIGADEQLVDVAPLPVGLVVPERRVWIRRLHSRP